MTGLLPPGQSDLFPDLDVELAEEQEEAGGELVVNLDPEPLVESTEHHDNLAEVLDDKILSTIGTKVVEAVQRDIESRSEWENIYADGIASLGVDRTADERTDPWPGASGAVHPVIAQASVEFAARAIKELFPAGGPVKTAVLGRATLAKEQQARRVSDYMNYQLTEQDQDYRSELQKLLAMLPLEGSSYKKIFRDPVKKINRSEYVPSEDLILPYGAPGLYKSPRVTHRMFKTDGEVNKLIHSGLYRDVDLGEPAETGDTDSQSPAQIKEIVDRTQGQQPTNAMGPDGDGRFTILECYIDLDIEGFEHCDGDDEPTGIELPYVVTVDMASHKVLSIYRNWKERDELFERRLPFVEYPFWLWRGAYGLGLFHLIGGLSSAATGALRALLDSAQWENMPGGLKQKGVASASGQEVRPMPGQFVEVDTNGDDIRTAIMALPTNGPSAVLFQLLGFLVEAAGKFATATNDAAETSPNAPVGTTLARIEQGAVQFSAIHAGLHAAQRREFKLLAELNFEHLDDEVIAETHGGELVVRRDDFGAPVDVLPVSDPNIFSNLQRVTLAQTVYQMVMSDPTATPQMKLEAAKRLYEALNVPDYEKLLPEVPEPYRLDPVHENVRLMKGEPIKAYPGQDNGAHIMAHLMFYQVFGEVPMVGDSMTVPLAQHLMEHIADEYRMAVGKAIGAPLPEGDKDVQESVERFLSVSEAKSQAQALGELAPIMQVIAPVIQKAAQMAQQMQAQQGQVPADPANMLLAQAEMLKAQTEQQTKPIEVQVKQQTAQTQAMKAQGELQQKVAEGSTQAELDAAKTVAETKTKVAGVQVDAMSKGIDPAVVGLPVDHVDHMAL
jgi:hypothetical protein